MGYDYWSEECRKVGLAWHSIVPVSHALSEILTKPKMQNGAHEKHFNYELEPRTKIPYRNKQKKIIHYSRIINRVLEEILRELSKNYFIS